MTHLTACTVVFILSLIATVIILRAQTPMGYGGPTGAAQHSDPWLETTINVMGADGKACVIVFGAPGKPYSERMLDHTTCSAMHRSGVTP
jgi:hypothetical protein